MCLNGGRQPDRDKLTYLQSESNELCVNDNKLLHFVSRKKSINWLTGDVNVLFARHKSPANNGTPVDFQK